jgi:hypothetical protein
VIVCERSPNKPSPEADVKPLIPIAAITRASETGSGELRLEFRDTQGKEGIAQFSPAAIEATRQALTFMTSASQSEVPTLNVETTAKVALKDGGYGLLLGLAGGSRILVRIPEPIVPGLRQQLAELEGFAAPRSGSAH